MPVITQPAELPKASAVQPTKEATKVESLGTQAPETKTPEQQKVSAKYLEQARFEKMRRKEAEEYKAKEQAWAQKEEEYKTKYIPREQIEKDAYGTLKSLGWDEQKILNTLMNPPTQESQELQSLRAKIEELESGQKKIQTTAEENQAKARETAINSIRNKATALVDGSADFEMIQKTKSHEAVVQLVVDTWDNEQRAISEEDAAKEIEEYLLEQTLPLLEAQKIKSKFNPTPPVEETKPQTSGIKTLTNSGTPLTQSPLSAKDRRQRAILAAQGKLNT